MAARPFSTSIRRSRRRMYERVPAKVPNAIRQQLDAWADAWLETKFTRALAWRAANPGPLNFPVAVFSEWRGKSFYLCARYRTPKGAPVEEFVVRSARMTMTGFGRFELSFFRHTGRWFAIERGLTLSDCLKQIEENEMFWPMT